MAPKTYTPQDVHDVLLDARELMNDKGRHWIKGALRQRVLFYRKNSYVGEDCYCSVGAIFAVTKDKPRGLRAAALKQLADTIRGERHTSGSVAQDTIMGWNDSYYREWKEVSRTFRTAARRALKGK